ncbi:haloacid dehalogenase-like hydrolase [mine drainage metagenome]|uniref:Haloacid dehalogenase-like hydrolase n=1 Tax=mine drainage metagenome TaxID=410659 RepID=A0A1J5PMV2_9ZZZZ
MNIVFDFGAVLFRWQPAQLVARTFSHRAATLDAAHQLAQAIFGHEDWHAFDGGVLDMDEVVQRTAQRLDLPHSPLHAMVASIEVELTPMPDTVDLLEQLVQRRSQRTDLRLYFLSNMPVPYARALEQRHAFLKWFDGGIFSGDVKLTKPAPAIYELLENRYALVPGHTVFIDDLLPNVACAQARAWTGIHFESAAQLQKALAALR